MMRRLIRGIASTLMVVMMLVAPTMASVEMTWAAVDTPTIPGGGGAAPGGGGAGGGSGGTTGEGTETPPPVGAPETTIIPNMEIKDLLKAALNILVYGLGAAAVLGVVIAGIMYLTARDNEVQVTKAKTRLIEVVIGLVAWAFMFGLLNWLIPGGLSF